MGQYKVLSDRFNDVQTTMVNGQERTTRKRYYKGDTVEIDDDRADAMVKAGGMAPDDGSQDDGPKSIPFAGGGSLPIHHTPDVASAGNVVAISGSTPVGTEYAPVTSEGGGRPAPELPTTSTGPHTDGGSEDQGDGTGDAGDGYEQMDYGDLQALAKLRGIPANQSKEALIEELNDTA